MAKRVRSSPRTSSVILSVSIISVSIIGGIVLSDFGNRQYSAGGSRYIPAEPQSESTVLINFAYERAHEL